MGEWIGFWGAGMWLLGLLWLFVLVAVLAAMVYILLQTGSNRSNKEDSALAVLREQYARGELSDEEYDRRRDRLDWT